MGGRANGTRLEPQRGPEQLKRLLPLLSQLVMGVQRLRGEIPTELQSAGRLGPRHVAALISLTVVGPASVSELAERLDMTLNHASLVVRELNRAGLTDRRADDADRRRIIISVTEARKVEIQEVVGRLAEPVRDFLSTLTKSDFERFVSQLASLITHLSGE